MNPQEKLDNFVKENKLEIKNRFVPFSFSRNAKKISLNHWDKPDSNLFREKDLSLNWKISIKNDKHAMTIDYSSGIALINYKWLNSFTVFKNLVKSIHP